MTNLEALEQAALTIKGTEHTARAHGLVCIWDGEYEYYRAADFEAGNYDSLPRSVAAELADGAILVPPTGGNAELPVLMATHDLGAGWYANMWGNGTMTLRAPDKGQRIDLSAAEVDRLRQIMRAS